MQTLLIAAACIAFLTGAAHSVLGEILIFRHLRNGTLVPEQDAPPLRNRHIRILWATWHLATVFGWAFAGVLLQLGLSAQVLLASLLTGAAIAAYAGGALLVLAGTRGRHPGWIALGLVAALVWLSIVR
jgi:cytosine/uracil/thiamine/allantoin permease